METLRLSIRPHNTGWSRPSGWSHARVFPPPGPTWPRRLRLHTSLSPWGGPALFNTRGTGSSFRNRILGHRQGFRCHLGADSPNPRQPAPRTPRSLGKSDRPNRFEGFSGLQPIPWIYRNLAPRRVDPGHHRNPNFGKPWNHPEARSHRNRPTIQGRPRHLWRDHLQSLPRRRGPAHLASVVLGGSTQRQDPGLGQ